MNERLLRAPGSAHDPVVELSAKDQLAHKLNALIENRALSQAEVARLLGMPQPKISAIRNHKLKGISLHRLMQALTALGQHVHIVVTPASGAGAGRIEVAA